MTAATGAAGFGADQALSVYHQQMLSLYRDAPKQDVLPPRITLDSLGTDHCPLWRQAMAGLPRDRALLLQLANDLLWQVRLGEALALSRWLVESMAPDAQSAHQLGCLLKGLGDRAEAQRWLRCACELEPERQDSPRELAGLLASSQPEEARRILLGLDLDGPAGFASRLEWLSFCMRAEQDDPWQILEPLIGQAEGSPERFAQVLLTLVSGGHLALALELATHRTAGCLSEDWESRLLSALPVRQGWDDPFAAEFCQKLAAERPDDPLVRLSLGKMEQAAKRYESAEAWLVPLVGDGEASSEVWNAYGGVLFSQGRHSEAMSALQEALRKQPFQADLQITLGMLHLAGGAFPEALAHYRVGLRLMPRCGMGFLVLGNLLRLCGDLPAATEALRRARKDCPEVPHVTMDLATTLLQQGEYAEAWPLYEARLHPSIVPLRTPIGMPRWDGQSPIDELIVVAEQGVGDLVQFMRYAPFLRMAIPRVSILAEEKVASLLRLFGGFSSVYTLGDTIRYFGTAAWLPLLSVPGLLGVGPDLVLMDEPYLRADPEALRRWNQILKSSLFPSSRLVGLNWQGNPAAEHSTLVGRSFPLESLAPLASIDHLHFVSLQKGAGSEQLEGCSFRHRFVQAQAEVSDCWDFAESAAILGCCDLVISCDSAVGHLAGALGMPTWLFLRNIPEWRWGLEGEATAWYPSMRLFRQPEPGDWASVVTRARAVLALGGEI